MVMLLSSEAVKAVHLHGIFCCWWCFVVKFQGDSSWRMQGYFFLIKAFIYIISFRSKDITHGFALFTSMTDRYHEAVVATQSAVQNKLWRRTLFWSLLQSHRGAGSLIWFPLLACAGIIFTTHHFHRLYKPLCTVGLTFPFQELPIPVAISSRISDSPPCSKSHRGQESPPAPRFKSTLTTAFAAVPCRQRHRPAPCGTHSQATLPFSVLYSQACAFTESHADVEESLFLSYFAEALKALILPPPRPRPQYDRQHKTQCLVLLPTAPLGDLGFHFSSFSMTTKISVSPAMKCTQDSWELVKCAGVCTSFSDILVQ